MKNLRRILLQSITHTVPLQTVLVVPFLLQVVGIVGVVAYVSYRNDQQVVQALAYDLTNEVAQRVSDRLNHYLQAPHQFLVMSRVDLEQGSLSPDDLDGFERRFNRQLQELSWLRSVHFTNVQGKYIGLFRTTKDAADGLNPSTPPSNTLFRTAKDAADGLNPSTPPSNTLVLSRMNTPAPGTLREYRVELPGYTQQAIRTQTHWDPRRQPWYRTAIENYTSSWTTIAPGLAPSTTSLTAVTPIYQNSQLVGVLGVDLEVEQINSFLKNLNFSSSGQVFVMERSGNLIATSTQPQTWIGFSKGSRLGHLRAGESADSLIQGATQHLIAQGGSLNRIQEPQTFTFVGDRSSTQGPVLDSRYFAQVFPYHDRYGLDWLVVVVIPARDLTGGLYENIRQTVIWTGFALLGAIALGVCTTRWIMQPILGLRDSANRMAQGEFDLSVPSTPILELRQLAFSFREMANQVQLSLYEMQALNADLNESRGNLDKFLDGVPVGVIVHHSDGTVAYLNHAARGLLGIPQPELGADALLDRNSQTISYNLYRANGYPISPPHLSPVARALQGEQVIEDLEIPWEGGGRIQVEVLATPILSKDGRISHAIVALQDITTRKEAARVLADYNRRLEEQVQRRTLALEQEIQERQQIAATLHQRETTLRAILSTIPDLLVRLKGDGSYIERLSDGEVQVLKADTLMQGQKLHDYLPEAIAQSRLKLIQRAIASGTVQIDEYQIQVAVGELRDEEIRVVKTAEDEVLIIVRDISDRKRVERALQQSEAHNRAILTAIPDLMFRTRRDGTYLGYVKTSALADLLPKDFDPVGHNIAEYLPPDVTKRHLKHIARALDTGQLQVYEQENWIDGAMQYEEVRVMPCGSEEVLFLIRDIGDRKRVEKELRLANLRLEQLAQTDGLTHVANRRHFDARLKQEWQTLAQEKAPFSLILFDVDYFKFYNDKYGHQAGDLCLIKIAAAARQIIRHPTDLVARYGGEEFAIILPRTDRVGAIRVAERLQTAIQRLAIPHAKSRVSHTITISLGLSTLIPTFQTHPDNLLTQADQALYLAKQQGRDRTVVFFQQGDRPSGP